MQYTKLTLFASAASAAAIPETATTSPSLNGKPTTSRTTTKPRITNTNNNTTSVNFNVTGPAFGLTDKTLCSATVDAQITEDLANISYASCSSSLVFFSFIKSAEAAEQDQGWSLQLHYLRTDNSQAVGTHQFDGEDDTYWASPPGSAFVYEQQTVPGGAFEMEGTVYGGPV